MVNKLPETKTKSDYSLSSDELASEELDAADDPDSDSELLPLNLPLFAPATAFLLSFASLADPFADFGDFFLGDVAAADADASLLSSDLAAAAAAWLEAGVLRVALGLRPRFEFLRMELT